MNQKQKGMKKRLLTLVLAGASLLTAYAQLNGAGYYRVKNATTGRYMSLSDNHSRGVNFASTSADCGAMVTSSIWDDISHDPGSVFYLEHITGESYNVVGQGTSLYDIIQYYIYLTSVGSAYKAWQEDSGQRIMLTDKNSSKDVSYVTTTGSASNWNIIPIDGTNNYVGVKPTVTIGSKHYAAVFAGYPYQLGNGMKAYYISKIDEATGQVVYKELGNVVPAKTPALIECSSTEVKDNVVTPIVDGTSVPSGNAAIGVYFCLGNPWSGHFNSTKFDASSMRVLAASSDGKLVVSTATTNLTSVNIEEEDANGNNLSTLAIPANSWYIPVSASAPEIFKLVSETEYVTGISDVKVNAASSYDVYTLQGVQVKKNAKSLDGLAKGIYIVNGKKVAVN